MPNNTPGWGAFLPRFNIPETFGTALSYEGQLHWFLENWDEVAEYANDLEQPTIDVGRVNVIDSNAAVPDVRNIGTNIKASLEFDIPKIYTRFADPLDWDFDTAYDMLTVVRDSNGNSYTSRQAVPANTALSNTDYWVMTGSYDANMQEIREDLAQVKTDYARVYTTVADMQADTTLVSGMVCHTLGFYSTGDGGAAWYLIGSGDANGMDVLSLSTNDCATLVICGDLSAGMLGAVRDLTNDDTDSLQRGIDLAFSAAVGFVVDGKCAISAPLHVYGSEDISSPGSHVTGLGIGNSVIAKADNTQGSDYLGNSANSAFIVDCKDGSGGHALHNFSITALSIDCKGVGDYGIYAHGAISRFNISSLNIENCALDGIHTTNAAYLGKIAGVRIYNAKHGVYLASTGNTSLDISNCYVVGCDNGYYLRGVYCSVSNCCAEVISGTCFAFDRFHGTATGLGSEATDYEKMYDVRLSTMDLTGCVAFPSSVAGSTVITNYVSRLVVADSELIYGSTVHAGRLLDLSDGSTTRLVGNRIGAYVGDDVTPINASDNWYISIDGPGGASNMTSKLLSYVGTKSRYQSDAIDSLPNVGIPSGAIFFGLGATKSFNYEGANVTSSDYSNRGDIYVSKYPGDIGGIGWVQTANSNNIAIASMKKIPIVLAGATSDRPKYALEPGQSYFDTSLGKPVWCSNVGANPVGRVTITTAPVSVGTVVLSVFGRTVTVSVSGGESVAEFRELIRDALPYDVTGQLVGSNVLVLTDLRFTRTTDNITVDVGTSGAVLTPSVDTYGLVATWVDGSGTVV